MVQKSFIAAPDRLFQSILPWFQGAQFGLFNVILGSTRSPDLEQTILDDVGSYGRQLGRIGDALKVILDHLPVEKLSPEEQEAITVCRAQLIEIDKIKKGWKA